MPHSVREDRTFTLFPKLPTELQLQIWEHALPGPRIINISPPRPSDGLSLPPMMAACRQSRAVILRNYDTSADEMIQNPRLFLDFWDPTLDTLVWWVLSDAYWYAFRGVAPRALGELPPSHRKPTRVIQVTSRFTHPVHWTWKQYLVGMIIPLRPEDRDAPLGRQVERHIKARAEAALLGFIDLFMEASSEDPSMECFAIDVCIVEH
jgi:hypothetical protein